MKHIEFTKNVEKLINPMNVGSIHFLQPLLNKLPKDRQNQIIENASKENPIMGFVVEPYSSFLCYEITDVTNANLLLSDNFELMKCKITQDDTPKYYALFGSFSVHTSAFMGQRMEVYLIANDKVTGLLTWIILDYDTNTISYDKKGGLIGPTVDHAVITTDFDGNIIVDVKRKDGIEKIEYVANIQNGKQVTLDEQLWIFGNLSVGYGKEISNNSSEVFSLRFDPREVAHAYSIAVESVEIQNTWLTDLIAIQPEHILIFPYAQHFLSDSPGSSSQFKSESEMLESKERVDFSSIKVYDPSSSTKMILRIPIVLIGIIIVLILALIIK